MAKGLTQLVAVFLLLAQGLVAVAPGRTLCLRLSDCGRHEQHAAHDHDCDADCCESKALVGAQSEHVPAAPKGHSHEDCGCHLCVPVPRCEAVPNATLREAEDGFAAAVPLVSISTGWWHVTAAPMRLPGYRPPDAWVMQQSMSLRVTRLLI